ncbi:transposase, mutator family [Clostridium puniceum]|uniref:Mutator family transposase n=1 Tax=Clostridium puniceum TaxID=29367 RepID=A0A1S8TXT9_9CLOT|nr:transposase, mutator family [Clostridium puniceum]
MENVSKELLREYIKDQNFTNANDILDALKEMFRDVLQESLEAEMDEALGYGKYNNVEKTNNNSRNGYSKKTVKTELGPVNINIPRDRNGDFQPKIVAKHQRSVNGIEDKILGLYATGMTTRDISEQIKELYGVDISAETVSNITNRILPLE